MVANRKVTGKALSMPAGIALGLAVSMAVTLITSSILAWLILKRSMDISSVGYGSLLILLLSSAIGAFTAAEKIKHRRALVSFLAGAAYYLALLSITALFFGGQYNGMGVTGLVILCGCSVVCILGLREGKGHKRGRRKTYSR